MPPHKAWRRAERSASAAAAHTPAQEESLQERARWWSTLLLRPGCTLLVAHIGGATTLHPASTVLILAVSSSVAQSAVVSIEALDDAGGLLNGYEPSSSLKVSCFSDPTDLLIARAMQSAWALSQLHQLIELIEKLPIGRFMLRRCIGSSTVICFAEAHTADAEPGDAARSARMTAGQTDVSCLDFLPVRWQVCLALPYAAWRLTLFQPARPESAQIPNTFPPSGTAGPVSRRVARHQFNAGEW